jgi:DNA-directed RNA polymerase delta subunit
MSAEKKDYLSSIGAVLFYPKFEYNRHVLSLLVNSKGELKLMTLPVDRVRQKIDKLNAKNRAELVEKRQLKKTLEKKDLLDYTVEKLEKELSEKSYDYAAQKTGLAKHDESFTRKMIEETAQIIKEYEQEYFRKHFGITVETLEPPYEIKVEMLV